MKKYFSRVLPPGDSDTTGRIVSYAQNRNNEGQMKSRAKKIMTLMSVLSVLLLHQVAQGQTTSSPDSALQTILNGLDGTRISLQQALENAMTNATAVRSAEATYLAAEGSVRREEGFYDPQLFFNVNHLDNNQPTSSLFSGAPVLATQQTASQAGVRVNLPIGTRIEAGINTTRLATNSQLVSRSLADSQLLPGRNFQRRRPDGARRRRVSMNRS